jgi:hypothetical protein
MIVFDALGTLPGCIHGYRESKDAIGSGACITSQMALLNDARSCDSIAIADADSISVLVKSGGTWSCGGAKLGKGPDLLKRWKSGSLPSVPYSRPETVQPTRIVGTPSDVMERIGSFFKGVEVYVSANGGDADLLGRSLWKAEVSALDVARGDYAEG